MLSFEKDDHTSKIKVTGKIKEQSFTRIQMISYFAMCPISLTFNNVSSEKLEAFKLKRCLFVSSESTFYLISVVRVVSRT